MSVEIKSPTFPESVADGTIANWLKKEGDTVSQDEVIAEIETDKVVLEVLAQSDGVISKIIKSEGETVISSEVIGEYEEGSSDISKKEDITKEVDLPKETEPKNIKNKKNGPAVKKILSEKNIDPTPIKPTGKDNRITKADVINHMSQNEVTEKISASVPESRSDRPEKRVPMSRLRSTIAKRLVSVKQETAMLTTFNEVDMQQLKSSDQSMELNLKKNMVLN